MNQTHDLLLLDENKPQLPLTIHFEDGERCQDNIVHSTQYLAAIKKKLRDITASHSIDWRK